MKNFRIEVCANSAISAIKAQEGGAYRVELCAGIPEGGTTPSYGEITTARALLTSTKLHVIIRPRGGDFLYNDTEQEIMLRDIEMAHKIGVDGIVIGCLNKEGDVDYIANKRLIEAAQGLNITFHRAFDMCRNPSEALEAIIDLGCNRILTSGGCNNAYNGRFNLKELVLQAAGRVIIMPGCGITPDNIKEIADYTGAQEFHFSGRSTYESEMLFRNDKVSMGGTVTIDEYKQAITNPDIVKAAIKALSDI